LATAKDDLETALKNHQKREESLNSRLLAQRGAEQELSEQMRRTEVNYRSARRDLTLALEQQNRLRLDYEALQEQYAQLHDEKAELEMLLQQLTPRLREASQYLRDMRAKTADQEEAEELPASEGDAAVPLQGAGKKNRKKSPA
jgi:chromosome segregation ATPase